MTLARTAKGMPLDDAAAAEFQKLYRQAYGEALSLEQGREFAQRALGLYDLLLRPLPEDRAKPALKLDGGP